MIELEKPFVYICLLLLLQTETLQEGKGECMDSLQAFPVPTHRDSFIT